MAVGGDSLLEMIPENILFKDVLSNLEPEDALTTFCAVACVSRTLKSSVNNTLLSSISSVDFSEFSMDSKTFIGIFKRFVKVKKVKLDCLRLVGADILQGIFLTSNVEELILLKGCSLSYNLIPLLGRLCPNLRVLTLELPIFVKGYKDFDSYLEPLLRGCQFLEALQIKVSRRKKKDDYGFMLRDIYHMMPQTLKLLKLDQISEPDTKAFLRSYTGGMRVAVPPTTFVRSLTHISLVLYIIPDALLRAIAHSLPLLVELDLMDSPVYDPYNPSNDLSDQGIQSLACCSHLTSLSLVRSGKHIKTPFKRVTDTGVFSLSEGCQGLESVRLGGFSKVSTAGFASILISCPNMKKFEIQKAPRFSDSAFQDARVVLTPLVEVKLVSCNLITSQGVCDLATSSTSLEVLDLHGCQKVADSCLSNISCLALLTSLNLGGTNVTDAGMALLAKGNVPISCLSLRGCIRVTDQGITFLIRGEGKICKMLSSLDLGSMPGITDNAVTTIADACVRLTELCIRGCLHVTDAAIKALALRGTLQDHSKLLRRLDLRNCCALSVESFEFLKKPLFRGLQWIGIEHTCLISVEDARFAEIHKERPWLTICKDGCEVGCRDGWQFHNF